MSVFVVNAGSSSIRLDMFAANGGGVRRTDSYHGEHSSAAEAVAVREFLARAGNDSISAVAHRIVHGGASLVRPCLLTAQTEREIERLSPLAPLHNPAALKWVHACREVLGNAVPQVAVFDTAFFADLPEVASTYALPQALSRKHGLKRYGFHGIAHEGMWRRWIALQGAATNAGRIVTLQLGSGCSVAAIRNGLPLDTSMGFSPLEGLVMATRSGDVDPGLLLHLQRMEGMSADDLQRLLNERSGLLGLSGTSGDMRILLASNEPAAQLAVDLYCRRACKTIGAYLAVLEGADAIVFGGGVGEHAPEVRARILEGLAWAGIELDRQRNSAAIGHPAAVHRAGSKIQIYVLPADEAELLAQQALAVIAEDVGRVDDA